MRVLISGASIAGPTLAYWLVRHGHTPTVVELAPQPRTSGYPIDVRGPAVRVAERMGVLPRIRDLGVDTERIDFVDAANRTRSTMDMRGLRNASGSRDIELLRGDLVATLYDATRHDVEYRFGDSIRTLSQDDTGVAVEFDRGDAERFDIVVGADGLHSQVRTLAFGPEADMLKYLGLHVGGAAVSSRYGTTDRCVLYNTPGKAAGVYRFGPDAFAIFLFRTPEPLRYDHRDPAAHKRLLASAFAGERWQVADLLADVVAADDFYFDSVSQIRLPAWSRGRVVLAGDAGYGPSLLSGSGTTLAMVGAYLLAGELAGAATHARAFARYETIHRPLVRRAQRSAGSGGGVLVPRTKAAIRRRNLIVNWSGPQLALARLTKHLPKHTIALPNYEYPTVGAE